MKKTNPLDITKKDMSSKVKKAKVLVATPNYLNSLCAEAHQSHMECVGSWKEWGIDFNWQLIGRTFVHFARTQSCKSSLEGGYTHILWLDDDAIIEPYILPRFIDHDKDIVIAPYQMRRPPYEIGVLKSTTDDFHDHASYRNLDIEDMDQGLLEVDGGGTHCMLVKTDVLRMKGSDTDVIQYPPQLMEVLDKLSESDRDIIDQFVGELPDESRSMEEENEGGKPFFFMPRMGTEDMLFCYRAKKKGARIYCDTDIDTGHFGFAPVVTREFRKRVKEVSDGQGNYVQGGVQVMKIVNGVDGQPRQKGASPGVREPTLDTRRVTSLS